MKMNELINTMCKLGYSLRQTSYKQHGVKKTVNRCGNVCFTKVYTFVNKHGQIWEGTNSQISKELKKLIDGGLL